MSVYSKNKLNELFASLNEPTEYTLEESTQEEYVPEYVPAKTSGGPEIPIYVPTSKKAGPRPLTIEEYKKRQKGRQEPEKAETKTIEKRRKRAGRAVKLRQQRAELHRVVPVTTDQKLKRELISKLKTLSE